MKQMTRRHYIWMIWIIIISFILTMPYIFSEISFFKKFTADKPILLLVSSQIATVFYWISLLYYFKIKKWNFSFYSGLALSIVSSITMVLVVSDSIGLLHISVSEMALIGLLYLISFILYCISFFSTTRTKIHKLIRVYAILNIITLVFVIISGTTPIIKTFQLDGIVATVETVVLILHFVRERHFNSDLQVNDSDEILDTL